MDPAVFSEIIGHETACRVLAQALDAGRLSHAYLVVGPDGVGKRTLARALIRAFVGGPIDAHPDVVSVRRLDDEKTGKTKTAISVEQMRDVAERLAMSALSGKKAVLVEEADRLQAAAGNALLKTLEEPRGDALIVLCALNPESVLATIASRCQIIRLHPVPQARMEQALKEAGCGAREAAQLSALAGGAPGKALALLRDSDVRAMAETALGALERASHASVAQRLQTAAALLPKEEGNKMAHLEKLFDLWEMRLHQWLTEHLARGEPVDRYARALSTLSDTRTHARRNVHTQLALERVLLSL